MERLTLEQLQIIIDLLLRHSSLTATEMGNLLTIKIDQRRLAVLHGSCLTGSFRFAKGAAITGVNFWKAHYEPLNWPKEGRACGWNTTS